MPRSILRSLPLGLVAGALSLAPAAGQAGIVIRPSDRIETPDSVVALIPSADAEADLLLDAMDAFGAYERLASRIEVAPDDYEARWRSSRAALALAIMEPDEERTIEWLYLGEAHADAAMALRPDDPVALVWAAAVKGRLALDAGGAREKVQFGQQVWDLTHRVLELEPNNALAHDVLGKLHQEVRRLGRVQRFLARAFLGSDPIRLATWEEAEDHLKKAIASDPTYVLFYLDLGETYWAQKKMDLAVETFGAGLARPIRFPTDPGFKSTIRGRLDEIARSR